jgi:hypothetical protein
MQKERVLYCPVCQFKNQAGSLKCVRCGTSLNYGTTTLDVPSLVEQQDDRHMAVLHRQDLLNDGVVFYVAGDIHPLIVRGKHEIVLGRHTPDDETEGVVGLDRYNAHQHGVSRRHAKISITDDSYLVEDLGSTNGTWLNDKYLHPYKPYIVTNGDQVRLGQLVMFVYFSGAATRQQVLLQDRSSSMMPDVEVDVMPSLESILAIQRVVDELLGRESHPRVQDVQIEEDTALVSAYLEQCMDAVQLVRDFILPWKRTHIVALARLKALQELRESDPEYAGEYDEIAQNVRDDLQQLAGSIVRDVTVKRVTSPLVLYTNRLLPELRLLTSSSLEIIDEPNTNS